MEASPFVAKKTVIERIFSSHSLKKLKQLYTVGEVIFKDTMNSPVAAILSADYRMDGKEEGETISLKLRMQCDCE